MKKLIALIALFYVATFATNAQTVHLKAGYSSTNIITSPISFFNNKSGFTAGIVVKELMLSENIGIQPELIYTQKGGSLGGYNLSFDYFALPLMLTFPMAESGVSVLVGPEISYLANTRIASLFSYSGDKGFNKIDVGLAGGLEYQISDNLAIGGRYTYGLTNVLKDINLTDYFNVADIIHLRNTSAQVYVTFGFGNKN
jgi:opacity protein-like surface antigen